MITQPITQITQQAQGQQMAIAAGERVFEFLDAELMEKGGFYAELYNSQFEAA